jgi:hypothetical protein
MDPAQLAAIANALASSSSSAPAPGTQPDLSAAMGTHSAPAHNGGPTPSAPDMSDAAAGDAIMGGNGFSSSPSGSVGNGPVKTAPASRAALVNALANPPVPPVRPANLGAPAAQGSTPPQLSAMASPPPSGSATMGDLTVDTPVGSATLPAAQPARPVTTTPAPAAMVPIYAADPGAAQRAAQYRALNPTGSPVGVSPAASQPAVSGTGNGILPTPHPVGVGAIANPPSQGAQVAQPGASASIAVPPGPMSASAAPSPAPAIQYGANDQPVPAIQYGASDRAVGPVPGDDNAPLVPGQANGSTSGNLRMLGQAGEDITRNIIAGVPFADRGGALINSYVNGDSYADELAKVRADQKAAAARQGPVASTLEEGAGAVLPGGAIAKGAGALVGGVPYVGGLLTDVGTGAALGGASAAGNDQNIAKGAMLGAGAGAIASPLAAAAGKLANVIGNRSANSWPSVQGGTLSSNLRSMQRVSRLPQRPAPRSPQR